jgi:predicted metallopeptidase
MKLIDAARVLRSKNAGPLKVTIDLMFDDRAGYERARQSPALSAASVARLYGLDEAQVEVLPYPPAFAIKLVLERRVVAGSPGDSDVYGAQQHGPLLELEL